MSAAYDSYCMPRSLGMCVLCASPTNTPSPNGS